MCSFTIGEISFLTSQFPPLVQYMLQSSLQLMRKNGILIIQLEKDTQNCCHYLKVISILKRGNMLYMSYVMTIKDRQTPSYRHILTIVPVLLCFLPVAGSGCCQGRRPRPEGRAEGDWCHFLEPLFGVRWVKVKVTMVNISRTKRACSYLFNGQFFETRQRAGEEADYKGGRGADYVQHGRWEHGDVRMLPGERVE